MSRLSITSKRHERFSVLPGHAQVQLDVCAPFSGNQPGYAMRNEWTRGEVASS